MNDPFNTRLVPGCKGTVVTVDDIGTIHVNWDCGSGLGIAYGEDVCKKARQNRKYGQKAQPPAGSPAHT